ncbi:MAG TPA: hypothetical protein PKD64_07915 [Pirellulaceae bacterium]|nr:hypothetical protein [Pirellulaceae bacterium]HMO92113.1 hypothetical protein [Pirellulaceae bacterium]HMP69299.1 hypothetical protein [Pirellulaceae bacterium]
MNAKSFATTLAIAVGLFTAGQANAQYDAESSLQQRLFQNQYTQPGASEVNARLYMAPQPVPANVGHTYYTYEPFYPHEHLYTHRRTYYNYYAGPEAFYGDACKRKATGGGALNKTDVVWQSGNMHYGNFPGSLTSLQSLQYKFYNRRYCLGATCDRRGLWKW